MDLKKLFEKDQSFHGVKGLLFFDDEHILAYQRDGNTSFYPYYWDLPGGGAEAGETPFETFNRELKEEFGLSIQPDDVYYLHWYPGQKDPSQLAYLLAARIDPVNIEKIQFGDEGVTYKVMKIEDYLADKIMPAHEQRVRDYLDWLNKQ